MIHIVSDLRFTLRLMRRSPAFFAGLLTVLIAGIGMTTAMFSVVQSLLLRPLPYKNAEDLIAVGRTDPRIGSRAPASIPDFLDWKAQATTLDYLAGTSYSAFSLSFAEKTTEGIRGAEVSGDFFPLFGIAPLQGRLLTPDDDRVGSPRVAVISAELWRRKFDSSDRVVGQAIRLSGEPYTIVGVAPTAFVFAGPEVPYSDIWIPLATGYAGYVEQSTQRSSNFLSVIGRLRHGVSLLESQTQLSAIATTLEASYPDTNTRRGVHLTDLHEELVGSTRSGILVLFTSIFIVFIMVCGNVGSLLLARAQSRQGEMATRVALGARQARLVAQLVTETVLLFLLAAIGGAAASFWLVGVLETGLVVAPGARTIAVHVDGSALVFCVGLSLTCGLMFGLFPALAAARTEPHTILKAMSARAGVNRTQKLVRSGLVIAQLGLACTLLGASALAVRDFTALAATKPGFEAAGLATARILTTATYSEGESSVAFFQKVVARIAQEPGVSAVAASNAVPMGGSFSNGSFAIEGATPWAPGEGPMLKRDVVTPGYFATMGIPLLRGRDFNEGDARDARLVMVISQATAERFFPGRDPIGQRIDWGDTRGDEGHAYWREIVGVVGNVHSRTLTKPSEPESYVPLAQHPSKWMMLAIRSPRAASILSDLPKIVQSIDSEQAVFVPRLMTELVADTIGAQRYVAMLLAAFACAALLLATIGLFGLMSYTTGQRTRELGLRMALGATPKEIVRLVMHDGARLIAVGLGLGIVGALFAGRLLASRIPGMRAFDPLTFAAIPLILCLAGLLACFLPAWRAVRIPPAIALRRE
jgi:putative ABC transport system permease protein